MRYIASCSFGKDSLAMVLRLIAEGKPLDEVVFYDTGMEFGAIYRNLEKMKSILATRNIKMVVLKPTVDFMYKAFDMPVKNRDGSGYHFGYSWCGGVVGGVQLINYA